MHQGLVHRDTETEEPSLFSDLSVLFEFTVEFKIKDSTFRIFRVNPLEQTEINFVSAGRDVECPVCHKRVPSDDVEVHLVMCFTRPQLAYNGKP